LPRRDVGFWLIGDHLNPAGDLTAVFNLQATATRGAENLAGGPYIQATAGGQGAVDGAGDFGILNLNLTFEHAARRDGQLRRMDHRRFNGALNNHTFSVLDDTLNADAAADDERPPF
jgi:hypothetical protein